MSTFSFVFRFRDELYTKRGEEYHPRIQPSYFSWASQIANNSTLIWLILIDLGKYEHKRLINISKTSSIIAVGGEGGRYKVYLKLRLKGIGLIFKISIQSH